jgi:hypothetical protein
MKNVNITTDEATVLQALAQNWYGCGDNIPKVHDECYTWSEFIKCCYLLDGMKLPKGKKLSGVCSSLVQKGLLAQWEDEAQADNFGGRSNKMIIKTLIGHTELGLQVWIDQVYGREKYEKAIA